MRRSFRTERAGKIWAEVKGMLRTNWRRTMRRTESVWEREEKKVVMVVLNV